MYGFQLHKSGVPQGPLAYVFTDASSDFEVGKSCAGIVIDSDTMCDKFSLEIDYNANIAVCEAQAIRLSLKYASQCGMKRVVIHTDCETLVRCIMRPTGKEPDDLRAEIKKIRRECRNFSHVSIVLVNRFLTEDAHRLAIGKLREIR